MRILCGHSFVAEVEAESVWPRLADHAGEQHRGGLEEKIGELIGIAEIPEYRRSGAQLAFVVLGVAGKCRGPAGHQSRNREPFRLEFSAEREDRCELPLTLGAARG